MITENYVYKVGEKTFTRKYVVETKKEIESGYRGFHILFNFKGVTTEIQIHTKQSWDIKEVTEKPYTKWRNLDETKLSIEKKAERDADFENSRNTSKQLENIFDNDVIKDYITDKRVFSSMEMQSFIVPKDTGLTTQDLEALSQVSIFSNPPDAERVALNKRPVDVSAKYSNDTNTTPSNDSLQQKNQKAIVVM